MDQVNKQFFNGRVVIESKDDKIEVRKITMKSGDEKTLLEFVGMRETVERNEEGKWVNGEPMRVTVKMWDVPEKVAELLKEGMVLIIRGTYIDEHFERKDGSEGHRQVLTAYTMGIDVVQPGLDSVNYKH